MQALHGSITELKTSIFEFSFFLTFSNFRIFDFRGKPCRTHEIGTSHKKRPQKKNNIYIYTDDDFNDDDDADDDDDDDDDDDLKVQ